MNPLPQKRAPIASAPDSSIMVPQGTKFRSLQKNPVGLQAVEMIKRMVIEGELRPGQALPAERELAAMLGISRPSLREAIRALTAMNILESRQGDGTFVTSLDAEILSQPISFLLQLDSSAIVALFEVRRMLEVDATALAADRITDEQLDELDRLVSEANEVIGEPEAFLQYDFEIHSVIIQAVQNPILTSLCSSIAHLSVESRRRTAEIASVRRMAHDHHSQIIAALRSRDRDSARHAMAEHLSEIECAFRESGATGYHGEADGGHPAEVAG